MAVRIKFFANGLKGLGPVILKRLEEAFVCKLNTLDERIFRILRLRKG